MVSVVADWVNYFYLIYGEMKHLKMVNTTDWKVTVEGIGNETYKPVCSSQVHDVLLVLKIFWISWGGEYSLKYMLSFKLMVWSSGILKFLINKWLLMQWVKFRNLKNE